MSPSFYDVLTRPKKAPLYDRKAGNKIQYLKNGEKYECTILGTKIAVVNRHYTFVIRLNEIVDVLVGDPFGVLTLLNRMDFITNAKTILEVRTKTHVLTETEALNKLKNTVKTEYYNRQVAELLFKIQLLANRLYHRSQTRISRTLSCGTKLTITSNMQTMRIENEAGLTLLFERPRRTTYPLGELGNKRSFYLTVATPIYALSFDLKGWIEDLIQSYPPTILFAEDGKLQRIAPDGKTQIRTIADSFIRNQNPFVLAAMNLN